MSHEDQKNINILCQWSSSSLVVLQWKRRSYCIVACCCLHYFLFMNLCCGLDQERPYSYVSLPLISVFLSSYVVRWVSSWMTIIITWGMIKSFIFIVSDQFWYTRIIKTLELLQIISWLDCFPNESSDFHWEWTKKECRQGTAHPMTEFLSQWSQHRTNQKHPILPTGKDWDQWIPPLVAQFQKTVMFEMDLHPMYLWKNETPPPLQKNPLTFERSISDTPPGVRATETPWSMQVVMASGVASMHPINKNNSRTIGI